MKSYYALSDEHCVTYLKHESCNYLRFRCFGFGKNTHFHQVISVLRDFIAVGLRNLCSILGFGQGLSVTKMSSQAAHINENNFENLYEMSIF